MIPAVFGKLKDSGFFFDPVARDIETNFIPSLLEKVKTKVIFSPKKRTPIVSPLYKSYFSAMRLNWLNLYLMSLSVT